MNRDRLKAIFGVISDSSFAGKVEGVDFVV